MEERKYNNISKEDLEKVLIKAGVFRAWAPEPPNDISRIVICEALGQMFQIEWWINQCYLLIGHMKMPFHWVRVDTTWPWWEYRRELHFENSLRRPFEQSDLVAVLGIEYSAEFLDRHPELKGDERCGFTQRTVKRSGGSTESPGQLVNRPCWDMSR